MLFLAQKERHDGFPTRRVRFANSLFYVPFCSAKRWTKSSSLLPFLHYTEKRYRGKSRYLFWRRRRDSTGFQPVVFALRTVYFMSLFAPQKDGRRVRVSPNKFIYTKRKSTKEKSLCFFCEDKTIEMFLRFRCLDLNTRHNHSTSLRFCFQGCLQRHLDFSLQRHLDFSAADKDHLDFLF